MCRLRLGEKFRDQPSAGSSWSQHMTAKESSSLFLFTVAILSPLNEKALVSDGPPSGYPEGR